MNESLESLLAEHAVAKTVIAFANAFDAQDWVRLRSVLADPLWTDYSEFRQEPPGFVAVGDYVKARESGLCGLRTLHVLSNLEVSVIGATATCHSAYQIYRVDPKLSTEEGSLFTVGQYEHGLVLQEGRWIIDRIRQTVVLRRGNPQVHGALRR